MEQSPVPVDELNTRVTQQIMDAERLDDASAPDDERAASWAAVSLTEEQLALHATSDTERQIARRGAIMAAEKSGDAARADQLRTAYGIDGSPSRADETPPPRPVLTRRDDLGWPWDSDDD